MHREIMILGVGGQGVLLAARILAEAYLHRGLNVVEAEAYSAETRGGESRAEIIVGESKEICGIRIEHAEAVLALYPPLLKKYRELILDDALLVYDPTYGEPPSEGKRWRRVGIPCARIAAELGEPRTANMIMLGAYAALTDEVGLADLEMALEKLIRREYLEVNRRALRAGYEIARSSA